MSSGWVTEREAKLPAWVQDTLLGLRMELTAARDLAEQALLATTPSESDAVIRRLGDKDIGLGRDIVVSFRLGPDRFDAIDIRLDRDRSKKLLVVHAANPPLVVFPRSGNAVDLGLGR